MARLIDADVVRHLISSHVSSVIYSGVRFVLSMKDTANHYEFLRGYEEGAKYIANLVLQEKNLVDAEPVVRCKDCKKRNTVICPMEERYVEYPWQATKANDFCSYGERKKA